jgi:hypothetical protein
VASIVLRAPRRGQAPKEREQKKKKGKIKKNYPDGLTKRSIRVIKMQGVIQKGSPALFSFFYFFSKECVWERCKSKSHPAGGMPD